MTNKSSEHEYVQSSGNVFADMGLEDADELLTRSQLGFEVRKILRNQELKQHEISRLLGIKQSEVSNLMKGKYTLFSEGRLFKFLNRLNKKIVINISEHQANESLQRVYMED